MPPPDKRRQIMQAAEKLFSSRRFHEVTLDEVAQVAKVGKGTIYLHFQDKDDLFFETANSGFDELCELIRRKIPERAEFSEQLLSACVEITRFFDRRRQLFRVMLSEDGQAPFFRGRLHDRWMEKRKNLVAAVCEILRRGVREGQVREDVPPEVLAVFLLGMLRARARDLRDAPEPWQRLELTVDLFRNGVAKQSAANAGAGPSAPSA
jgi:TetR/AcrR family fatty acid metabolism transcriptional regulator